MKHFWNPYLDLIESNETDPKTKLQEISQKKFKTLPEYKLLTKKGPSHSPIFTISLKALNFKSLVEYWHINSRCRKKSSKENFRFNE